MNLTPLSITVFFTILLTTSAYCPNGCNGQGTCGAFDKCTCYERQDVQGDPAWQGADCSLRTCPKGNAWVDVATAANSAHASVECSNMGLCDRETGVCGCFPGYEGKACDRSLCPNDCSGRGVCLDQDSHRVKSAVTGTYGAWDGTKAQGCYCDVGFRGSDCSLMECPSGADILLGDGGDQGRECGGRGICDTEFGNCACFAGYYGTACGFQTTVV